MSKKYDSDDCQTALEQLVKTIVKWHKTTLSETREILKVQDGTEIKVDYHYPIAPEQKFEPMVLSGETLKAFKMGVIVSMLKFEDLPFHLGTDDEQELDAELDMDFPEPSSPVLH